MHPILVHFPIALYHYRFLLELIYLFSQKKRCALPSRVLSADTWSFGCRDHLVIGYIFLLPKWKDSRPGTRNT
jgi:uncharacterized membrane protein